MGVLPSTPRARVAGAGGSKYPPSPDAYSQAWLPQLPAISQRPTNPKGTKRTEPPLLLSNRARGAASTSHLPARSSLLSALKPGTESLGASGAPLGEDAWHPGRRHRPRDSPHLPPRLSRTGEEQERAPALLPSPKSLREGTLEDSGASNCQPPPRPLAFSSPSQPRAHAQLGRPERPGSRKLHAVSACRDRGGDGSPCPHVAC